MYEKCNKGANNALSCGFTSKNTLEDGREFWLKQHQIKKADASPGDDPLPETKVCLPRNRVLQ